MSNLDAQQELVREPQFEEHPGPPGRRQHYPPYIPKPRTHNITNKVLQEAFSVQFYNSCTMDWQDIKMSAVVKVFKVGPLLEHSSEFEPAVKGFNHQSLVVKQKIYDKFVANILTVDVSHEVRNILFAMLESASEDRWLFVWLAGQIIRSWPKPQDPAADPIPHAPQDWSPRASSHEVVGDEGSETRQSRIQWH
ncbi:hypothetical protein TWF718_003473 [Orbilia javanica]|uniref:Uncharacterized protein n=1 Tax=Orbilia javanica TaxID=47235 RepID=A0AAN8RJ26_9PEZI